MKNKERVALSSSRFFAEIMSSGKTRWYQRWRRGYIQALKDIQYFLDPDLGVAIAPLNEYRAVEGLLEIEED